MSLTKATYSLIEGAPVNVLDYGATGDGTTDDHAAFSAALTAASGRTLYVPNPAVAYKIGTGVLAVPNNTAIVGETPKATKIRHAYNGNMFTLGDGASLVNLYLDGDNGGFTGKAVSVLGANGRQLIESCKITAFTDECLYFEKDAGSQSTITNLTASRTSAGTGTGRYAIVVENALTTGTLAVPRKFTQIETGGTCSFSFGGANNLYVSNSFLSDLEYTTNSRAVFLTGCRIANAATLEVFGANHTIVGCDVGPEITLSAIDNCAIQGNSYNNLPIVLNSGNARNLVDQWVLAYTPVLTAAGTAPVLGNGTLTGSYSFDGSRCFYEILLTLGSTTTLGTGELIFSLPAETSAICVCGTAWISAAATNYTAIAKANSAASIMSLVRDTSGSVTFNSPGVFTTGDFIRITGSFFAQNS
jgi:hypothetical protein